MNRPAELFLSHASADLPLAAELARTLRRHGVPVWFSRTDIRGSQQWHDEIGEALNRCDWFAVILTPNAIESRWMKREMVYALNDDRYDGRIIPLRFAACAVDRLSWVLPQLQAIDFQQGTEDAYRELLRLWELEYRPA
jgi:hypothetical protein